MSTEVTPDMIDKGLSKLAELAGLDDVQKGHSSRGTKNTEVASMEGESGSTQLYHTSSNSDPGTWAGTSQQAVSDNGPGVDSVAENGTDYVPQGKMAKAVMDKVAKGLPLTQEEMTFFRGMMVEKGSYGPSPADQDAFDQKTKKSADADKDDEDDEDDEDTEKSLVDFASENEKVQKGLEISEFLYNFVDVVNKSLERQEERITGRVLKALSEQGSGQGEFHKSLAEAIHNVAQGLTATSQRLNQLEQAPARAPRSEGVVPIEKSVAGGSLGGTQDPMSALSGVQKSVIGDAMVDLVKAGELDPRAVISYDSTSKLSPEIAAKVAAKLGR